MRAKGEREEGTVLSIKKQDTHDTNAARDIQDCVCVCVAEEKKVAVIIKSVNRIIHPHTHTT